jgi:transcriptional regulator with XRE-family HTH domain
VKLGEVLAKERKAKKIEAAEMASRLGVTEEEYARIEAGETSAEEWGPRLAQIAITLEVPTSRLLAESGRFDDTRQEPGQAGNLIRGHRERRARSLEETAEAVGVSVDDYRTIEAGDSEVEKWGPLFLGFAEQIEQPVFNLFYPCGLPFQELDDYP